MIQPLPIIFCFYFYRRWHYDNFALILQSFINHMFQPSPVSPPAVIHPNQNIIQYITVSKYRRNFMLSSSSSASLLQYQTFLLNVLIVEHVSVTILILHLGKEHLILKPLFAERSFQNWITLSINDEIIVLKKSLIQTWIWSMAARLKPKISFHPWHKVKTPSCQWYSQIISNILKKWNNGNIKFRNCPLSRTNLPYCKKLDSNDTIT